MFQIKWCCGGVNDSGNSKLLSRVVSLDTRALHAVTSEVSIETSDGADCLNGAVTCFGTGYTSRRKCVEGNLSLAIASKMNISWDRTTREILMLKM